MQTESYSSATDNFKVEELATKSAENLCTIHENGVQNLQFTSTEFAGFFGTEF